MANRKPVQTNMFVPPNYDTTKRKPIQHNIFKYYKTCFTLKTENTSDCGNASEVQ